MVRIKHRYVVGQVLLGQSAPDTGVIQPRDVLQAVRDSVQCIFGDIGSGRVSSSLSIRMFHQSTKIFVLRVPRESATDVWFAISALNAVKKIPVVVRVLRLCGSVRTCKNDVRMLFERLKQAMGGEGIEEFANEDEINKID